MIPLIPSGPRSAMKATMIASMIVSIPIMVRIRAFVMLARDSGRENEYSRSCISRAFIPLKKATKTP